MSKLTSGRVKKLPQSGLTSDRYQFLGLNQAEPDLGDPLVGVSSIVAKPFPPGNQYVMINIGGDTGSRYWIDTNNLQVGTLSPGAFTIFNNDVQIGLANSFTTFNFVGTGVTVDFVGPSPEEQTGIATVRIAVVDVLAPGDDYQIPYNDPITGFLRGASGFAYRPDRNEAVGIGTELTNINYKLDVIGNVGISSTLYVDEIDVNFIDALDINVGTVTFTSGVGTDLSVEDISVGLGGTILKTVNSLVGIGSTLPQYDLDVNGDIRLGGLVYDFTGSTGTANEVLLSAGPNTPPAWGGVTNLTIGNAERVNILESDVDEAYPLGFATQYSAGQSSISVDSNTLVYNPGTNRLGIGTADPQYDLEVPGIIRAGQLIVNTITDEPDVVNTTSLGEAVLDSFLTSTFRSTRYTIQTTVTGQLREGRASIASTTSGQSYVLGTYTDVPVVAVTGVGTGALADITVQTETSPITASEDGIFTTSNNIAGVVTGTSLQFDQTLEPTDAEQSKLTSVTVTNTGAGFTDIPNIVVDSPIIAGNPVDGVGSGVTAVVTEVAMNVTNVVLNSGVTTSSVPVPQFTIPASGTAAQGYVEFGVSSFEVTQPGSAYTESPTVNYDQTPTVAPTTQVGLGISDANIQITGGSGHDVTTTFTVDPPPAGGVTATIILGTVDGGGAITDVDITNVGSGYTQIPNVTIGGAGVGGAVVLTEMIVTNIDVTDVGSGFGTSKPAITFTGGGGGAGAAATVSDVTITSIEVTNSGAGYTAADMPVTATFATLPGGSAETYNISVTNSGASAYLLTGSDRDSSFTSAANETITFVAGDTMRFDVNASGHPFYLKTSPGTGTGNQIPGVINNGAQVGLVTWTTSPGDEGTYYYQCSFHSSMVGTINVITGSGIGNTVALGVTSVTTTTGLGYTVAPGFTIDAPTIAPLTGAAFTSGIGYGPEFNILPGPGYGGTTVYYINGIDASTFRIATDVGVTDFVELGYDISLNPNAYIGGSISTITITEKGSGYATGDVLTVNNTDLSSPVGTGFTFSVNNLIESYQVSDLLLLQSSGSAVEEASVVEYAGIGNIENLGDYDADISGPNARLKFTPNYAFNTIKISRKGISP